MKDEATLITPTLGEIILTPAEIRPADATPIRDEQGGVIDDQQGNPLLEG